MQKTVKMDRKRKPLEQLSIEEQATEQKRSKSNLSYSKNENRAGTLVSIVLRNFMSHSYFEVKFDSNINFFTGRNGSGKSAILTAVLIGLGGRATLTNRGNSIKSFVKVGKKSSYVEITLYNAGLWAYKPDIFGNQIIIHRSFSCSGNSQYKIKTSTGEVISSSTKELSRIMSYFNIQIENPVCILNQDISRNFLTTNDSRQRFKLFFKATCLDELKEEYNNMKKNELNCISILQERKKKLTDLEAEIVELGAKWESHKTLLSLKERIANLQNELLWAEVCEAEAEYEQAISEAKIIEERFREVKSDNDSRLNNVKDIEADLNLLNQQINELRESFTKQNNKQLIIGQTLQDMKNQISEKKREKRLMIKAVESKEKEYECLQNEIKNFTLNLTKMEEEKMKRMEEKVKVEEKLKELDNCLQTARNDCYQMKNSLKKKEEENSILIQQLRKVNNEYNNTEEDIRLLRSETHNSLLVYGKEMPRILQAINENKHKFKELPRGPIGRYIKVKEKKWTIAVEGFLSPNLLQTFIVDNKNDCTLLRSIFDRCCISSKKPSIITSKFIPKVHDVRPYLVETAFDYRSIYDVLEISDNIVLNCLIDQSGIESVILILSNKRAIELMSEVSKVPKNCKQAVTIEGDRYYPDPGYRTYGSRYHQARFLQTSTTERIQSLNQQLKSLSIKKQNLQNEIQISNNEIRQQKTIVFELQKKVNNLLTAMSNEREKYNNLKSVEDVEIGNLNALKMECLEVKADLDRKKSTVDVIENMIKQINENITKEENKLQSISDICSNIEERITPIEEQILDKIKTKKNLLTKGNFERARCIELEQKLEAANGIVKEKKIFLLERTKEASSISKKIDNPRGIPVVMNEINNITRMVRKIENTTSTIDEILKLYKEKISLQEETSALVNAAEEDLNELQKTLKKRSRHYKLTEDFCVTLIKHSFQNILRFRQFSGNINIDLEEETLDLIVIPQHGSQGITTTANLSGGERSFSTVAFLYSLWQCVDFPFYFLDEFDVFMDKLNRSKVMEVLIHHAKSNPELQFMFITPQDVSFIKDKSITIHRLEDPKRNSIN